MKVGKIEFGELDAKNEAFRQSRTGKNVFYSSFIIPPNVEIDDLLSGSRFFILGQKGCGKTALMLNIERLFRDEGYATDTLLFKSDVTEIDRQQIISDSGYHIVDTGQLKVEYDYLYNWLWMIYATILRQIKPEWVLSGVKELEALKALFGVTTELPISKLRDLNLKELNGKATLNLKIPIVEATFATEVGSAREKPAKQSFIEVVKICENHIGKVSLKPQFRSLMFLDELELFANRADQKERDLFLIRDLLRSVVRANRVLGSKSASFGVYACVRTEVLSEVNRVGQELARDVEDFGVVVRWDTSSSADSQPILEIVESKIQHSEIEEDEFKTEEVWERYFPEAYHGRHVADHLVDISMFKPRLILLRLNLAKKYNGDAEHFASESFEETNLPFSTAVWREVEEQLATIYPRRTIDNLRTALTAYSPRFTPADLERRFLEINAVKPGAIDGFRTQADINLMIGQLYELGALGNQYTVAGEGPRSVWRDRWAFRGFEDPVWTEKFIVHESLRKFFQMQYDGPARR